MGESRTWREDVAGGCETQRVRERNAALTARAEAPIFAAESDLWGAGMRGFGAHGVWGKGVWVCIDVSF